MKETPSRHVQGDNGNTSEPRFHLSTAGEVNVVERAWDVRVATKEHVNSTQFTAHQNEKLFT